MTRRRNPLARLLRLREIKERTTRREFGRARRAEQEAADAAFLAKTAEEGHVLPSELMRPAQLRAMRLMGVRLREIREAADAEHDEARRRLEPRRGAWQAAAIDADAAEALVDKRNRAVATAARAAAERALDDLQVIRRAREGR
jgi:flagellar biosynthesis chaperone FliJ